MLAPVVPSLRLVPKIAAMEPGATGKGARAKLAPLTIPPGLIYGAEEGERLGRGITIKPASVIP